MSTFAFPSRIAVSRTDSIGDVIVTLPLCGFIKKHSPNTRIVFIGRSYTQAIVEACPFVDEFLNFDKRAESNLKVEACVFAFPDAEVMQWVKAQGVKRRIATGSRIASWKFANYRVFFSRKNSDLHEAQLNFHLLYPFGVKDIPTLEKIRAWHVLKPQVESPIQLEPNKRSVVFHMLSKGSALNWSLNQYQELAALFPPANFNIYITGTEEEGVRIRKDFQFDSHIIDLTGKLSLPQLIAFISSCETLVAASTGPLHIASAVGIRAIGLYPSKRPMHPGRWMPLGINSSYLEDGKSEQKESLEISPEAVSSIILGVNS
ncbi:MAG: glycosyltransferase family 9 protein [Sediminibacterium sp.]